MSVRKFSAIILSLFLVLAMVPASALAADSNSGRIGETQARFYEGNDTMAFNHPATNYDSVPVGPDVRAAPGTTENDTLTGPTALDNGDGSSATAADSDLASSAINQPPVTEAVATQSLIDVELIGRSDMPGGQAPVITFDTAFSNSRAQPDLALASSTATGINLFDGLIRADGVTTLARVLDSNGIITHTSASIVNLEVWDPELGAWTTAGHGPTLSINLGDPDIAQVQADLNVVLAKSNASIFLMRFHSETASDAGGQAIVAALFADLTDGYGNTLASVWVGNAFATLIRNNTTQAAADNAGFTLLKAEPQPVDRGTEPPPAEEIVPVDEAGPAPVSAAPAFSAAQLPDTGFDLTLPALLLLLLGAVMCLRPARKGR